MFCLATSRDAGARFPSDEQELACFYVLVSRLATLFILIVSYTKISFCPQPGQLERVSELID